MTDPTHDLWTSLGPPPTTRGGLAAWCGIAEQLEAWSDRHARPAHLAVDTLIARHGLGARVQPGELSILLSNAANVIHTASRLDSTPAGSALEDRTNWQATIENTQGVLAAEQPALRTEHDLGLEL